MGTSGNPNGRPPGRKEVLPRGVAKLIRLARKMEENDPLAHEAMGIVLQVMRGEISGRHLRDRLSAAIYALERARGKPRQTVNVEDRRQPGSVVIGDTAAGDSWTVPVPEGPAS